ncbi:hypothetical protein OE88DRAFT_1661065 [Heliocybe sulcata]|uniref:Uncharacterized protein n=1 Tax=Heliocybe sulcata TaxID=5364 RepID=A0A5C3N2C9_9AGAM|nr:hypothetical protein OE88DRAFT_1661065 [Heliocybe sulcata]
MASPSGSYDHGLLASAPAASRAERQGGYDVDLLDSKPPYNGPPSGSYSSSSDALWTPRPRSNSPVQTEQGLPAASKPKKPLWRTGRGVTIIVIATLLVIMGAVIGGAVGGTAARRHKSNDTPASPTTAPAQSDSSSTTSIAGVPVGTGDASTVVSTQSDAPDTTGSATVPSGGIASELAVTAVLPARSSRSPSVTQAFAADP